MNRRHRHGWLFLRKWLREPMKIAAPWPSSRYLADAMCGLLSGSGDGAVVELGGGTGAVTRSLLARCFGNQALFIIEKDKMLAGLLADKYPEATVIEGDASELDTLLRAQGVKRISAVVSSLPMMLIPERTQFDILRKSFAMLDDDGLFVQYTYGTRSPIAFRVLQRLGIIGIEGKSVWRNLPPARVWTFRQSKAMSVSDSRATSN
jgi:phosphatidylethanolamine/phosphatidyl-N-methylethanolamine N-methyltransferase